MLGVVSWSISAYKSHVVYAPVSNIRQQPDPIAIERLGPSVTPDVCMAIAQQWEPGQPGGMRTITWTRVLGELGDRRAVPTLIALTDHQTAAVRLYAVLSLSRLNDPRSIPALKRMIHDLDHRVAMAARGILGVQK